MFQQKRRSMLGRRHLLALQQDHGKSATVLSQPVAANRDGGASSNRGTNTSWRGQRSEKKKTPIRFDKASKEFKKCLFSKSPGVNHVGGYSLLGQGRKHHSSCENLLNETGITSLTTTPSSSTRSVSITPASAYRRRVEVEKALYGPVVDNAAKVVKSDKPISSLRPVSKQTSCTYDFDNLKPPDSPGPSRLEILEKKLQQNISIFNYDSLKPPISPGASRLDKLIMKEKLELPLDPDLKKLQTLSLGEPTTCLQFSPPLSSTCIGTPDSGKKNETVLEEIKSALGSGRKLSTIKEDCDMSVIEFELNERTISELDDTIKEIAVNNTSSNLNETLNQSTINNTIMPNNVTYVESVMENHNSNNTEEWENRWEMALSCLDNMEQTVMNRAVDYTNALENLKRKFNKECQEDISRIRSMRKSLESFKHVANVPKIKENKENEPAFKVPTCKKKPLDEESRWLNSVKAQNPDLLKTPQSNRKMNQSSVWTPHSLTNVLNDQLNVLYDK